QVVHRAVALSVEEVAPDTSWSSDGALSDWLNPERQQINLGHAPLIRLTTAEIPKTGRRYALLQLHHLICDNRSLDLMLAEITAYLDGMGEQLPPPTPYRNHVAEVLAYSKLHDTEAFFRSKLEDVDEPTAPFAILDVRGDGSRIEQATLVVEPALAERVRVQSSRIGVTAAVLFHAV